MSQTLINALPRVEVSDLPVDKPECNICTIPYNDEDTVPVRLSCGHIFCLDCMQGWFTDHSDRTCPTCRTAFPYIPSESVRQMVDFLTPMRNRMVLCVDQAILYNAAMIAKLDRQHHVQVDDFRNWFLLQRQAHLIKWKDFLAELRSFLPADNLLVWVQVLETSYVAEIEFLADLNKGMEVLMDDPVWTVEV